MSRRWRKRIIILAIPLILVAGSVIWLLPWFVGRPFDSAKWNDPKFRETGIRLEMADWLITWGTLHGKTRREVTDLLGEPSRSGYFSDWDLVYWLGPERTLFGIDSEWLVIRCGPDGRVADYRIVAD